MVPGGNAGDERIADGDETGSSFAHISSVSTRATCPESNTRPEGRSHFPRCYDSNLLVLWYGQNLAKIIGMRLRSSPLGLLATRLLLASCVRAIPIFDAIPGIFSLAEDAFSGDAELEPGAGSGSGNGEGWLARWLAFGGEGEVTIQVRSMSQGMSPDSRCLDRIASGSREMVQRRRDHAHCIFLCVRYVCS